MAAGQGPDSVLFGFSGTPVRSKTLLDALSEIQQYAAAEAKGVMPREYLTAKGEARLFGIGFVASLSSVITTFFLVPLGMYVLLSPGDKATAVILFAWALMVFMPLCMAGLLSTLAKYHNKGLAGFATNWLLCGVSVGGVISSMVAFAGLYLILKKVLLGSYILLNATYPKLPVVPQYILAIPLPSAWLILGLHVFCPLIPCLCILYFRSKNRERQLQTGSESVNQQASQSTVILH